MSHWGAEHQEMITAEKLVHIDPTTVKSVGANLYQVPSASIPDKM